MAITRLVPSRVTVPDAPSGADPARVAPPPLDGTGLLFAGYLVLLADTYLGLSSEVGILKALHAPTLLAWGLFAGVLLKVGPKAFWECRQNLLLGGLVLFTGVSILIAYVQLYAFEAFRKQFDYFGLCVMTTYLLDRPSRVSRLAMTAGTMILVLVGRNIDKLNSSLRESGFRAESTFMGDGNDFAWGLTVLLPLAAFLFVERHRLPVRLFGMAAVAAAIFGIVGTQSRGATVSVAIAGLVYIALVARRKVLAMAFACALVALGLFLAPSTYTERMQSIATFETDNSALGRMQAWKAAIAMSISHPIGVGADNFNSAYGRFYLPQLQSSMIAWGQDRWISPHSIYFRALAEYGVLGLILLLAIVGTNVIDNLRVRRALQRAAGPGEVPNPLPGIVTMAVVGHAMGGVFLGGLTYPHLHLLSGITAAVQRRFAAVVPAVQSPRNAEGPRNASGPVRAVVPGDSSPRRPAVQVGGSAAAKGAIRGRPVVTARRFLD